MDRRKLLKGMSATAAVAPFLGLSTIAKAALRAKITDIRPAKVKLVQKLGLSNVGRQNFHSPSEPTENNIGGFGITEIYTDKGAIGVGPGATPQGIKAAKDYLVGKDPFDVADHSRYLNVLGRPGTAIEMALWDLCGKLADLPLNKLWGGGRAKIMPYGATFGLGEGPKERSEVALQLKNMGFKAVKMRASFPTMKEDIEMMTLVRQAIGPDTLLLVDANKAGPYGATQLNTVWDYQRALGTALEFEKLGTYWLEEPLGRFDYENLHKLHNQLKTLRLAGGESDTRIEDFRDYAKNDCYDVWNCDTNALGPTLWRECAALAFANGYRIVPHASGLMMTMVQMHLAANTPNPAYGELDKGQPQIEIDTNLPFGDYDKAWSVFTNAPKLDKDGLFAVPTDPGVGVTIRPDLIDRT